MTQNILILGGQGRIGSHVAYDLATHTNAQITITGRQLKPHTLSNFASSSIEFLPLDLENIEALRAAIKKANLVIHCAGPFHYRDGRVLKICLEEKVNYIDVSDHRSFYHKVLPYAQEAIASGVTAILNTGVFPGISNSMVRQAVEQVTEPEKIHLSYVVGGSGGAGITAMRTTFLGLRTSFEAWINGQWQKVLPYSERETIQFPPPYGKVGVYWFDVPETYSFAESFPVKTVITKFGSLPDFYNHLTWITAHVFPSSWIESKRGIEFFSHVSYKMTSFTDKFSGIGVAMHAEVIGKNNQKCCATMVHENTAIAAGCGTGSVASLLLENKINKPGIWPIEQVLPTDLFLAAMESRGIKIDLQPLF